ncbi:MAG: sugar phosphate nucleotidyltransferase, partial [Leptotrichiaceae bacterium]|nr:sugar phosphate nucleotidyltransferase [Leptotrichiaceae bacterium]
YKDSIMSVLPSDHLIKKENEFLESLDFAFKKAEKDIIVTLGIKPSYPETGYGYIEYIKNIDNSKEKFKIYKVRSFREKPNREIAEKYIEKGNYLWNSGMFIWKTEFILSEIRKYMETHRAVINKIEKKLNDISIEEIYGEKLSSYIYSEFSEFEKISIDFGVMEHTKSVSVIPVDMGWNDVGSFKSLEDVFSKDENGNIIKSEKYEDIESEGNIIINKENHKIIAAIGLEDIVIVNTEDALLVCSKEKSQEIKKILGKIEKYKK